MGQESLEEVSVLKIRIRFAKYGAMRFIGHLDLMRFFQKAIRKAGIDISFTEGLSPHMIMSFAAPLGLGVCGMSEYADIAVDTPAASDEAVNRLNAVTVEGIEFLDFVEIPDGKAGKAMSLVTEADYAVRFRRGYEPEDPSWPDLLDRFLAQPEIVFEKETKKGSAMVDLKPMIHGKRINDPFPESAPAARRLKEIWEISDGQKLKENSESFDGQLYDAGKTSDMDLILYLRLATGSAANLKPELLMEAFAAYAGLPWNRFTVEVGRLELYTVNDDGQRFSLLDLGSAAGYTG